MCVIFFWLSEINGERLVCGLLVNEEILCRPKIEAESILSLCDQRGGCCEPLYKVLLLLHKLRRLILLKEHPKVVSTDTLTISFCTLDLTVTS